MTNKISVVKRKLDVAITQLCEVSWMFSEHPERDFTRTRKLPFRKVISFLLCAYCGGKRPLVRSETATVRSEWPPCLGHQNR